MTDISSQNLDFSKLIDLVNGRLKPEEALTVLGKVENNPKLSEDLELVLALMGLTRQEWERQGGSAR